MSDPKLNPDVDPTKETALPDEASLNPDGTVLLQLVVPVPWGKGEEPVTELRFVRPKGAMIRAADMSDAKRNDSLLLLAGKITGRPPSFIDSLDIKDAMNCVRVALYFFDASPPTGRPQ
jgi:hypothetical protein